MIFKIDDLVSIEGLHKITGIERIAKKIFYMVEIHGGSKVLLEGHQLVKAPEPEDLKHE